MQADGRLDAGDSLPRGDDRLGEAADITESLPGRAAILHLLPMSRREISGNIDAALAWEAPSGADSGGLGSPRDLWRDFIRGGYPELVANPGRDIHLWHSSYTQTYLERDVRSLRRTRGIRVFQSDLRDRCGPGFLIHSGAGRLPMGSGVTAVGFSEV